MAATSGITKSKGSRTRAPIGLPCAIAGRKVQARAASSARSPNSGRAQFDANHAAGGVDAGIDERHALHAFRPQFLRVNRGRATDHRRSRIHAGDVGDLQRGFGRLDGRSLGLG